MGETEYSTDEAIAAGLTAEEIQAVARRQLIASVAVAVVIAFGVAVAALMPGAQTSNYAEIPTHKVAGVQQPKFVQPLDHGVASAKPAQLELP